MILAIEDALSEAVTRKLVGAFRPELTIYVAIGNRGNGYLREKAMELNRTAASVPVFLLTDQDAPERCPPELIQSWLPLPPNRRLLFRVAVMEVESWILADREGAAQFLGVPEFRIPADTDTIRQPKEFIVNLARRSRTKSIREDLVPRQGSTSIVGPAYNARLTAFVEGIWNPRVAADASPSLDRAIRRLLAFMR